MPGGQRAKGVQWREAISYCVVFLQVFVTLVVSVQYQVRRDHTFDAVSGQAAVVQLEYRQTCLPTCW